jgi:hypothetical protein
MNTRVAEPMAPAPDEALDEPEFGLRFAPPNPFGHTTAGPAAEGADSPAFPDDALPGVEPERAATGPGEAAASPR